ncbi:hypothetical protein D6789_04385 [Candidatus Woesearchaeota archaeon]|nr:MAG: hypothetical protein D6789_04385 [Candidatus Woesearchaeota archaeon]
MRVLKLFLHPWMLAALIFLASLGFLYRLMQCSGACVGEARLFLGTLFAAVGVLLLLYELHHHLRPLYFLGILLAYILLALIVTLLLAPQLVHALQP